MPKILTQEECENILRIPYDDYQKIIIVDKPTANNASDTRRFNDRVTHALIELTHMIAKARADEKEADFIFKKERAGAMARLSEAKIRAKARPDAEKGQPDANVTDLTSVDPSGLNEKSMQAISETYAYKASGNLRDTRRTTYLGELWESLVKLGRRINDELVAFGIENKMSNRAAGNPNV